MKKKLAVAVTVALLAFPLGTTLAMAETTIITTTAPATTATDITTAEVAVSAYEAGPITTLAEVATVDGLKAAADTAVGAVGDEAAKTAFELRIINRAVSIVTVKTTLQAEVAVAAYEAGSITTLAEVTTTEGLKTAADTAVAAVGDGVVKTALELRITTRAAAIATAKPTLQAESAVVAYEAGPITTLAEVTTAEGLKTAADTAVAALGDGVVKTAFELRVTTRTAAIATAKTALTPVVDDNGNPVTPANWFTDLISKLQLALTFDPARKCQLNQQHALAKLAEAQKLTMEGKTEAAQISLNQYTDKITKAQAFLDSVKDPTSEAAITLAKAISNVDSNNIQVLSNLIDKLPPQAAQKLALNVVRSMEKAVKNTQKKEAVVAPEVIPAVTPVATAETERKFMKKEAKVALEEFKKAINEKGKIQIINHEEKDNEILNEVKLSTTKQEESEQKLESQGQVTLARVNPVKAQTGLTLRAPENHKDNRNKQEDDNKDKGGDNRPVHK